MRKSNTFTTKNSKQTQKLGETLARELKGGEILALTGELGSGKTTFAQGVLKGLGAKGPHTSPTFVVLKHYKIKKLHKSSAFPLRQASCRNSSKPSFLQNVYHLDCYRVRPKDILELGWEEIIADKKNVIIVEWAERIKSIIPKYAIWLEFEHLKGDERKIIIKSQYQNPNVK